LANVSLAGKSLTPTFRRQAGQIHPIAVGLIRVRIGAACIPKEQPPKAAERQKDRQLQDHKGIS
jgi:hypothetical protein